MKKTTAAESELLAARHFHTSPKTLANNTEKAIPAFTRFRTEGLGLPNTIRGSIQPVAVDQAKLFERGKTVPRSQILQIGKRIRGIERDWKNQKVDSLFAGRLITNKRDLLEHLDSLEVNAEEIETVCRNTRLPPTDLSQEEFQLAFATLTSLVTTVFFAFNVKNQIFESTLAAIFALNALVVGPETLIRYNLSFDRKFRSTLSRLRELAQSKPDDDFWYYSSRNYMVSGYVIDELWNSGKLSKNASWHHSSTNDSAFYQMLMRRSNGAFLHDRRQSRFVGVDRLLRYDSLTQQIEFVSLVRSSAKKPLYPQPQAETTPNLVPSLNPALDGAS